MQWIEYEGIMGGFLPTFLDGATHRWYETLEEAVRNSWDQVQERFLEEFGPREKYSNIMIEITKLGQGVNEKIRDYYARSQELRRKIEVLIRKDNLGDKVIDGFDRLLLKQEEIMEKELDEIIVPPSPCATTRPSTPGTSLNSVSSLEYDDLIHKMGQLAINLLQGKEVMRPQ